MRWLVVIYFFLFIAFIVPVNNAQAQCISFARNIAKPQLAPFIHDGNYNATYMEEGESAELYKTFFAGEEYRLVVATVESLPKLRIRILDDQRNVIFDNADHQFAQVWDFEAKSSGTMIVYINVPDTKQKSTVLGGCVAILFGVKANNTKKK